MDYTFTVAEVQGALQARYRVRGEDGKLGPRRWVRLWPKGQQPYRSKITKKKMDDQARRVIEEVLSTNPVATRKGPQRVSPAPAHSDPSGMVTTLGEWLSRALLDPGVKGSLEEVSRIRRDRALEIFVHWCSQQGVSQSSPITLITPSLIQKYADHIVRGGIRLPSGYVTGPRTAKSMKRDISPIQRAFNWLLDNEEIEGMTRNPVRVRVQQFYNADEQRQKVKDRSVAQDTLDLLLDNCDGTLMKNSNGGLVEVPITVSYMHPAIMLMSHSGMRPGEARQAKWNQIDWDSNVIHLTKGKKKHRDVPMPESLKVYLRERLENLKEVGVKTEYILCLEDGSMIKKDTLNQAFNRYRKRLGLDESVAPYGLRHHFAHKCADNNVPITHLQSFMGHSSLRTTQVYTHSEVENVIDSLKGVF